MTNKKKKKKKGRYFSARESTVMAELRSLFEKMEVEKWDFRIKSDNSVIIAFLYGRQEHQYYCDHFDHQADNMRAAQLGACLLWRVYEEYKVSVTGVPPDFGLLIMGFRVLEGEKILQLTDGSEKSAFEVLGIERNASRDDIDEAWRKLVKIYHPDCGGNAKEFKKLTRAYEELQAL